MNPQELSQELRLDSNPFLDDRRAVVLFSLLSMACMGIISLFQIGVIKHLPEPPLPKLDADKVDASAEAYSHLQMGDAFIGMGSYSVTAALAAAGGKDRVRRLRWLPLLMAGKAGIDAIQAGRLTYQQFSRHKAACFWCLVATAATLATAYKVVPEARAALFGQPISSPR